MTESSNIEQLTALSPHTGSISVRPFRMIDLFSGIGGFALAATWTWGSDLEIVSFVEKDPYCQKVLNKNFKGVPIHDDITTYDGKTCGTIDLITGGFPCQPFSVAGKQKSKEDDRYLWPEMLRVISEARPAWVIGENVAGIVKLALDDVLADLDSLGYSCQPFIIPAAGVGARHRRDRIWIVARNTDGGDRDKGAVKKMEKGENTKSTRVCADVPDTISNGLEGTWKKWETKGQAGLCGGTRCDKIKDVSNTDGSRLQESRAELKTSRIGQLYETSGRNIWSTEPSICRVAHGIPKRVDRLKCLGNAIVPQVVFPIMQGIKSLWRTDE